MSSVVLQVGQCGNQLGEQFWKIVLKHSDSRDGHVYLHPDGKLRSVNVDSEPKVVRHLVEADRNNVFREKNILVGKRGRGTNWALGYHGVKHGGDDILLPETIETVRKEVERCDSFSGIILMHSLSGGTGSGLGSRLCEDLRDQFPMSYLLSCTVAPHSGGESPLQHYNSLLCLAWLQRYCDGVILFQNDEVLYRLGKSVKSRSVTGPQISFRDMNHHIASCLCGALCPVDSITPASGLSTGMEPWELVRSLCPMPTHKFLHINHTARSKASWDTLTSSLLNTLQRHNDAGNTFSSLANLVVARGNAPATFPTFMEQAEAKVKAAYNCVAWNPYPVDCWMGTSCLGGQKEPPSLTMAANYSNVVQYGNSVLQRALVKYNAKAYLHWYWKHGAEQGDFEEAFDTIRNVVTNYTDAVR